MTQGWTGRKCVRCHGTGREYRGPDEGTENCPACGGAGEEYGDLDEPGVKIEEPPR
jgi:hypothetical protein